MMKLTFEGATLGNILDEMHGVLERFRPSTPIPPVAAREVPAPVAKPVEKPVEKPVYTQIAKPVPGKKARTEKQLANDEKMRVAALERVAAKRAAKAAPVEKPVEKPVQDAPEAQPFAEPEVDPTELVNIRQKTIEELQAAFANGHQKEVFELLSRFGNGAKSFRELPPEAFQPIRNAIDLGALE